MQSCFAFAERGEEQGAVGDALRAGDRHENGAGCGRRDDLDEVWEGHSDRRFKDRAAGSVPLAVVSAAALP
ncbi:hypothetical protein D3C83_222490 [compost metagenome]